jgi:hypothetical protein
MKQSLCVREDISLFGQSVNMIGLNLHLLLAVYKVYLVNIFPVFLSPSYERVGRLPDRAITYFDSLKKL